MKHDWRYTGTKEIDGKYPPIYAVRCSQCKFDRYAHQYGEAGSEAVLPTDFPCNPPDETDQWSPTIWAGL